MSQAVTMRVPAPEGERFAAGAFDEQLGKPMRVVLPGGGEAEAILWAVLVPDGGAYADLTLEAPGHWLPTKLERYGIRPGW